MLGLIVLTPNGANLGVVATNLYEQCGVNGRFPDRDLVTFHRLGPNGAYGWVAKSQDEHTGTEIEVSVVYGVIGDSVKPLTTITSYLSNSGGYGIRPDLFQLQRAFAGSGASYPLTAISADVVFETYSSARPFYPIVLRVSGLKAGRPFRGSYRLVFDKNSLAYLAPNTMPDEIKPVPFIAFPEPGTLSLACKGTETLRSGNQDDVLMGIVVNFTTRTVQLTLPYYRHLEKITGLDDERVAFGEKEENGFIGTIDRVTGDTEVKVAGDRGGLTYSLHCKPVQL
jgi:hypothetical protein